MKKIKQEEQVAAFFDTLNRSNTGSSGLFSDELGQSPDWSVSQNKSVNQDLNRVLTGTPERTMRSSRFDILQVVDDSIASIQMKIDALNKKLEKAQRELNILKENGKKFKRRTLIKE